MSSSWNEQISWPKNQRNFTRYFEGVIVIEDQDQIKANLGLNFTQVPFEKDLEATVELRTKTKPSSNLICYLEVKSCKQIPGHQHARENFPSILSEKEEILESSWEVCHKKEGGFQVTLEYDEEKISHSSFYNEIFQFEISIAKADKASQPASKLPIIGTSMAEDMRYLLNSSNMSDFKIICRGQEFPCHKLMLSARSDVFRTMLDKDSNFAEAKTNVLKLEDFETHTVKAFLDYVYTDAVKLNDKNIKLLYIAHKYNVSRLISTCASHLSEHINDQNASEVLEAAYYLENKELFEAAVKYMQQVNWIQKAKDQWTDLKTSHPELVCRVTEFLMAAQS